MENKKEQIPVFLTERMMRKIMEDKECAELIIHTFLNRHDLKLIPNTYDNSKNYFDIDKENKLCRIMLQCADSFNANEDFLNPASNEFKDGDKYKNFLLILDKDYTQLNKSSYFFHAEIKQIANVTVCRETELYIINIDYEGESLFSHLLNDLKCDDPDKIRNHTLRRRIKEILAEQDSKEEHE